MVRYLILFDRTKNYYVSTSIVNVMKDVENPESIIATQSKILGSGPARMYLTEDKVILGDDEINRSDINDLEMIEDDRIDYRSVGVILLNSVIGVFLAYSATTIIPFFLLIVGISSFAGYAVVKVTRDKPYGYVSLDTEEAEYRFGIADPISAAEFFGAIYSDLDKDLTHSTFLTENQMVGMKDEQYNYQLEE